jgi:hypothetical protein
MSEEKTEKRTMFFCERYPHLKIVVHPQRTRRELGEAVLIGEKMHKHASVQFVPNPQGVGQYLTSDPMMIEGIKESDSFRTGIVFIANESPKGKKIDVEVTQGAVGVETPEPQTPAPADVQRKPKAAKTPGAPKSKP